MDISNLNVRITRAPTEQERDEVLGQLYWSALCGELPTEIIDPAKLTRALVAYSASLDEAE